MQHGLVIFDLLFSLVQDPTKAIHPAMSPIDDLTMGFETLVSLITGLDMRLVAAAQPACLVVFVRAEPGFLSRTTRLEGFECIPTSLMSCVFAAATTSEKGSPLASVIKLRFSYPYT